MTKTDIIEANVTWAVQFADTLVDIDLDTQAAIIAAMITAAATDRQTDAIQGVADMIGHNCT